MEDSSCTGEFIILVCPLINESKALVVMTAAGLEIYIGLGMLSKIQQFSVSLVSALESSSITASSSLTIFYDDKKSLLWEFGGALNKEIQRSLQQGKQQDPTWGGGGV